MDDDSRSPREQVVRSIICGLYDGRYTPGQRLKEIDLTKSMHVSRGPVREALNRLAASGIVSLTLQRGAQVRRLSRDEAIGILVIVQSLVGIAARFAAERAGVEDSERLNAALNRLVHFDPASNAPEHALARDHFYATLTDVSGNAELKRILPTVQIHLIRTQFRAEMAVTHRHRHDDYRRITKGVMAGKPAAAENAAKAHIARAIAALRAAI
ncbi:GntR family transcriptional regulator [Sphingosinicella soli]|uniref:GntR family transcriptional regulator n=1 Tax=Sphingosinicella soli TaxID=333708 RepID=UPI00160DDC38